MKTEVFFYNHNNFYLKYGTQHACPYGFFMVVISMSSFAKNEKIILVKCITRVLKEIITLFICFAGFYNFVKHLNSYSS